MSPATPTILLARLRASTRLIALVLIVFVMKIGMVTACSMHDLGDQFGAAEESSESATSVADSDDTPGPFKHGAGGCVDCSCHHAAGLLPEAMRFSYVAPQDGPVGEFYPFRLHAFRRELRPPIS